MRKTGLEADMENGDAAPGGCIGPLGCVFIAAADVTATAGGTVSNSRKLALTGLLFPGSADLVGEPVAGSLPGDSERHRDPVPAPPTGTGRRNAFSNRGLIAAYLLGGLGDRSQVRQVFCCHTGRVKVIRELLKTARSGFDFSVCMLHEVTFA